MYFFSCGYVFLVFYVHIWLIFENKFIFEVPLKSKIIFGNWSLISFEKEKYSKIGDEESYWFVRNYPKSINDVVSEMSPDDCWGIWEGYWHFAPPPPDLLKNCEFIFYTKTLITNILKSNPIPSLENGLGKTYPDCNLISKLHEIPKKMLRLKNLK